MMGGIKVALLFFGYSAVGMGGDYAVNLVDRSVSLDRNARFDMDAVRVAAQEAKSSQSCEFKAERRVRIDAAVRQGLAIEAGSGSLTVDGREGLSEVRAVGRVCASREEYLEELQLTLERVGDDIVLTAHYPDHSSWRRNWRGDEYARIDLEVEIPRDMPAIVEDGSGDMRISGTGDLRIDDGSGEIFVDGVAGSVAIEDGSGEIEVRGVKGDVEIEDGSGEIMVSDIEGSLFVEDGSGEIEAFSVGRDVVIDGDGSGSISVRDVGGDFDVRADGSGSIRYSGVEGNVDVPRKKRRHDH